jgi:hypothetical protein
MLMVPKNPSGTAARYSTIATPANASMRNAVANMEEASPLM